MQLIAEAYDLLRSGLGATPAQIAEHVPGLELGRPGVVPHRDHRRRARPHRRRDRPAVRRRRPRPGRAEGHRPLDGAERPRPRRARSPASPRRRSPASLSGHAEQRAGRAAALRRPGRRRLRRRPRRRSSTTSARRCTRRKVVAYAQGFDQIAAGSRRVRLGHRPRRDGDDLARRLHHPGPLPGPDQGGVRRPSRTCRRCWSRPTSPPPVQDGVDSWRRVVADGRAGRHPDAGVLLVAGLLRRAAPAAAAGGADPGSAGPLRRAHLPAHRPRRHLPHRCGRRTSASTRPERPGPRARVSSGRTS